MAELSSIRAAEPESRLLNRETVRLESNFANLLPGGLAPITAAVDRARALGDDGLLGRTLCLLARGELFWGRLEGGIATVEEAIAAFERLETQDAARLAGPHSEAWRVVGNAWVKLGNIASALPPLERAMALAERGLDSGIQEAESGIPATSALIRGLNNLGMALISMREMPGAKEALRRAFEVADHYPQVFEDVPDDIIFVAGNVATILQDEARERIAAGEGADDLLAQARQVLEERAAKLIRAAAEGTRRSKVSALAVRDYLEAAGHNLLLEGRLDEAFEQFQQLADNSGEDRWRGAVGERGLAEVLLAMGRPEEAMAHAGVALAAYDQNEEVVDRANVFLVMSRAHQAMGQYREALHALEEHHRLRGRLDARAAQQYAGHMAARLGLERARAEAEAQRRIAAELKELNGRLVEQALALELHAEALVQARTAAEEASRAKSAFLANMSHELRTPLNAILGFSEMLRDGLAGPPGPSWHGYAGMVHDAGSHLLSVIGEILDLSKIEAGRVVLDVEPVDLGWLFRTCRALIQPMMDRGGITFSVDLDAQLTEMPADPVRLKQILLNLLSNAAKFTPQGGLVTLSARPDGRGFVEFRVADTGIGMTPVEVQLALEVFGQVENGVARKHQGSGLGLPIALGLAELHGGTLTVESEKGTGTIITVRLPETR